MYHTCMLGLDSAPYFMSNLVCMLMAHEVPQTSDMALGLDLALRPGFEHLWITQIFVKKGLGIIAVTSEQWDRQGSFLSSLATLKFYDSLRNFIV